MTRTTRIATALGLGFASFFALRRVVPRMRFLLLPAVASASARGLRFRSWPITEAATLEPSLKAMGLHSMLL